MKKTRVTTLILCLLMTLIMCLGMYKTAYADSDAVTAAVQACIDANGKSLPGALSSYIKPGLRTSADETDIQLTISDLTQAFHYTTADEDKILQACSAWQSNVELDGLDAFSSIRADTGSATSLLSGFMTPLKTFLGILVTLITIGMTIFSAFDLCYIAFPVFRGKMDEAKANGTKGVTKTGKGGETKLTIVTEDAQYAVVAADMANSGENPFLIYFKKRVVSYVVLAVLLFILITGKINVLANIGVKLASGIIDAIGGV